MSDGPSDGVARARLPGPMRALGHRSFRLYFTGQAISILGSWIQQVALSWLVYRLTGSSALLGLTAFAALIPQLLVGPFAGAWIDRHDRRRLLIGVQALLSAQALALALLTGLEWIGPSLIVAMALALGVLNAFDAPLRQSLISSMVGDRQDLPNALALNAMLFNLGRFVGPPIAGVLVSLTSEAFCFALNAVSFLALAVSVYAMRVSPSPRASGSVGQVFREGLDFAIRTYAVRTIIQILALLNLTASAYAVLLPVFAKEILGGDAQTLGLLWGAAGCGAFASTVYLATRKSVPGLINAIAAGTVASTLSLAVFALTTWMPLALAAMVMLGFGISVCNVGANTVLQTVAPDRLRGRIVSFFTATRFGFDAIGGLVAGLVAARIDAPSALLVEAALLTLGVAWLATHRRRLTDQVKALVAHH